jgi:hypothetical protein
MIFLFIVVIFSILHLVDSMDDLFRSSTSNHKPNTTNVLPKLFTCLVFQYFDSYLMNVLPGTRRAYSTFLVDVEINNKNTTNNTKYIWKEGAIYHILQHDVAYNTLKIITSFIPVKRDEPLQRNSYLLHTFYLEYSEWVMDCCLAPIGQFISYIMLRRS